MELEQTLHMNGGVGERSYANNSQIQREVISMAKAIAEEAVTKLYNSIAPIKAISIADLGCSSGQNTFFAIKDIVLIIDELRKRQGHDLPEFTLHLNDLPGNDYNSVFRVFLHDFRAEIDHEKGLLSSRCFVNGVPGSFYGRLFAANTLHFVHSSNSLMWLSKVPHGVEKNGNYIYIASTSPKDVIRAYYGQFQTDFSTFLKCRSEELVNGGKMVLTILGRMSDDASSEECCLMWELMAHALGEMLSEGLIEEAKLHSFSIPQYTPSPKEIEIEVMKEGSFNINRLETSEIKWAAARCGHGFGNNLEDDINGEDNVFDMARCIRSVSEPLLVEHFGQSIIDPLFRKYNNILRRRMSEGDTKIANLIVSMTKGEISSTNNIV